MKQTRLLISFFTAAWFAVVLPAVADAQAEARTAEQAGNFKQAAAFLQKNIGDKNLPAVQRRDLEFELDRLDRIRLDFPLTREMLFEKLKKSVAALERAEFETWIAEKRFDVRLIDGEERFMVSSVANLFWRFPELSSRRTPPKDESAELPMWENAMKIKRAAVREHSPYVLPKTFEATMTVTVDSNAVPHQQIICAWLPVPRAYPYQDGFEMISSSSPVKQLAPETSAIRSAYLEQPAKTNEPTVFKISFRYATRGVSFDIDPAKVVPFDGSDADIAVFTREAEHVRFTPAMRELSAKILGGETNPARKARRIYDWISTNIQYSFAIEYSTIPNISEYCRAHRYGDCGQEALLFSTLCRLNGVPARWQSGWDTFPGAEDIHDWTEIYLAPYGWVPVDPCAGILAMQYFQQLSAEQRTELRDFYFGGRSQWRMAANADHSQLLQPPKNSFRSDDVDFQRGELESDGRNIYFNHYHYAFQVKEIMSTNTPPKKSFTPAR